MGYRSVNPQSVCILSVLIGLNICIGLTNYAVKKSPVPKAQIKHDSIQDPRVIFIDFGANCGNSFEHFSNHLLAHKKLEFTEVHLFEPQPQVFTQWLVPLRKKNGDHVHIYNAAASHQNLNVTFFIDTLYSSSTCTMDNGYPHGASSLHQEIIGPNFEEVHIPSVDVAEFIQDLKIRPIDFVLMKIDIEAHEYSVIRHMLVSNVLCKHVDELWVEWHDPPHNILLDKSGLRKTLEWILTECVASFHEWTL